jgi:DNA-binding response OmpR family regulator
LSSRGDSRRAATDDTGTLLVVDDSETNRDLLSRRLERKGYRVLTAESGPQALEIVSREPVDVVLLDIMMPGMNGMDVLRALRKAHSPEQLPVIMVTAKAESEDIVDALEEGANDYVVKPIDFPVCLARLQAQLRTRRGVRAAPAEPETIGVGSVLADRYRIEARIGSGAFGTVYRARHLALDYGVAVKVLQAHIAQNPESHVRFQQEGISACRVRHPNAVSVLDFAVTPGGVAYLVMELLEGHSLVEEIAPAEPFRLGRCIEIGGAVCSVLAEAHRRGIVHRDVKPANVFLHRVAGREQVKVLDFGIAKLEADGAQALRTQAGRVMGTPAYMAPERLRGDKCDGKSDVYSVGVLLYEMLSGRLPVTPTGSDPLASALRQITQPPVPLSELRPGLPAAIEEIVTSALREKPAERPDAEALGAALGQAAALVREESPAGEETPWPGLGPASDAPTVERPTGEATSRFYRNRNVPKDAG